MMGADYFCSTIYFVARAGMNAVPPPENWFTLVNEKYPEKVGVRCGGNGFGHGFRKGNPVGEYKR
jgi:hypothetical protein